MGFVIIADGIINCHMTTDFLYGISQYSSGVNNLQAFVKVFVLHKGLFRLR